MERVGDCDPCCGRKCYPESDSTSQPEHWFRKPNQTVEFCFYPVVCEYVKRNQAVAGREKQNENGEEKQLLLLEWLLRRIG